MIFPQLKLYRMSSTSYKIVPQPTFIKEAKRLAKKYKSFKDDLQQLNDMLTSNPNAGDDLGGGLRKIRLAISDKNKGKSHGARVITYTFLVDESTGIVNLVFIYDKLERDSISKKEIRVLLKSVGL